MGHAYGVWLTKCRQLHFGMLRGLYTVALSSSLSCSAESPHPFCNHQSNCMLQVRVSFTLVVGCPLPMVVSGWSHTGTTPCPQQLAQQCFRQLSLSVCSVLNRFSSVPTGAVSLILELWLTSQVPTQVACKRSIPEAINDHILLLLKAKLGVSALRQGFSSGELCKQTCSVQTPVPVCFSPKV